MSFSDTKHIDDLLDEEQKKILCLRNSLTEFFILEMRSYKLDVAVAAIAALEFAAASAVVASDTKVNPEDIRIHLKKYFNLTFDKMAEEVRH